MARRPLFVILGIMLCVSLMPVKAFKLTDNISIRKIYDLVTEGMPEEYKKKPPFPETDLDVLELERLKQGVLSDKQGALDRVDVLPAFQKQLEAEATRSIIDLGQREEEEPAIVQHRPQNLQSATNPDPLNPDTTTSSFEKPSSKPFYGAARLAFGQNPEILPSTSTTTPSSTSAIPVNDFPTTPGTTLSPTRRNESEDPLASELEATKNGERRSINATPPKLPQLYFNPKARLGYTPFDMAEYVFWTGDETGVARAVEAFIDNGLMSRESAIRFLKDIRLNIEYLQNVYNKNKFTPIDIRSRTAYVSEPVAPTTTAPHIITTGKQVTDPENPNSTPNLQKAFEGIPSLIRLQEISNSRSKDNIDYDEVSGRTRLADFLYNEYSLEEVIFQLAKVMFSQSLTHGSEQSQRALQRLTEFLETEGEQGRISPNLQKKVLDVLLAALSDTLGEHPELLTAARSELGSAFHKLPQNNQQKNINLAN